MCACSVPRPWASVLAIYPRTSPSIPVLLNIRHEEFVKTLIPIPKSSSNIASIMKRKNFAAAYGSPAMVVARLLASGPAVDEKLSKSISAPVKTWAIGSFVSEGFIVIHKDGGPFIAVIPHI
jgi:hypothetical protein